MAELKVRDKYNTGWHSLGGIGSAGPQGYQGWQGFQGTTGHQGVGGSQGPKGNQGYQGTSGYQGNQGVDGNQGWQGTQGGPGDQGSSGIEGDQGYQGEDGNQGYQGTQGGSGNQGYQGVQGAVGIAGIVFKGAWNSGDTYDPGDAVTHDGTSYVCFLESLNHEPPNATYWQILAVQGAEGNVGPQGVPGDQGNQGEDGVQGSTGNAGQQGVPGNQGVPGDQGNQGEDGVQGVPGNQGPTGLAGQQGVDGQQGATGVLGAVLVHSVLIGAGGSIKIGSGTKDDNLNGVYLDDTEIVLQKNGANVLVMTAAGTFNFIVGSGDNLTVSSGGGILVESGGSLALNAGGDINFGLSDSDPSLLNWGDAYYMAGATTAARGLAVWPDSADTGYFLTGWDPIANDWKRFDTIHGQANNTIIYQVNDDSQTLSTLELTQGNARLYHSVPGPSIAALYLVAPNAYIAADTFYPLTPSATTLGKSDRYWSAIFGNTHYIDAQFRLAFLGDNPLLNFDANDYILYDRSENTLGFFIGSTLKLALGGSGGLVLSVGDDAEIRDVDLANTFGVYGQSSGTWGYVKAHWTAPSSLAYKKNVTSIDSIMRGKLLNELSQIELRLYHRIGEPEGTRHLGIVAEEAPARLIARRQAETDPDEVAGIDVQDFVSMALFGVKEALEQINQLRDRVKLLEPIQ